MVSDHAPVPPPTGWPQRKQLTRKRLEDVALRLFAERGFEQTTVDHLAAASGVGRRTIFRYFRSKNDIVFGALDERLRALGAELSAAAAEGLPPLEMMRRAFHVSSRYEPSERASLAMRIRLIATVPSLQAHAALRYRSWEDTVRAAVAKRTGAYGGVYARACAKAVIGVMCAAFETWRETGAGDDLSEIVDAALDVLALGLETAEPAMLTAPTAAPTAPTAAHTAPTTLTSRDAPTAPTAPTTLPPPALPPPAAPLEVAEPVEHGLQTR